MPPWLEIPLTLVAVWSTLYLLVWALAPHALSPTARRLGWAGVAVSVAAVAWSLWAESIRPAVQAGQWHALALLAAQVLVAGLGLVLALVGAIRFLRAWLGMGWAATASPRAFLETSAPLQTIRRKPTPTSRLRAAAALIGRVLRLPGLGWVPLGVGLTVEAFQLLEPDPTLAPDPAVVRVGAAFIALGLLQMLFRKAESR